MPANNPTLKRPAKAPTETKSEQHMVSKGYDKPENQKMKNISTTLSESEHLLIDAVVEAIAAEAASEGLRTSKRSLVRKWIIDRAQEEAQKRGVK